MRVCIILSTYNGKKYVCQQLDSIFQSAEDMDIFLYVRDDGSKDDTIQILEEYGKKNHVEIKIDAGENAGSARSFLLAIRNCPKADYYAFCDQDDVWLPKKIATAVKQIGDTEQPILWCSDYQVTDANLNVILPSALKQPIQDDVKSMFYNNVPGCTMFFNWALMQKMRMIEISEIRMHDIMAMNVALITGEIYFEKNPFVLYRQHGDNVLGYSHKKIKVRKWIKDKMHLIRCKENYSTAEYARAVLKALGNEMSADQKKEYQLISEMDKSFIKRLRVLAKPYTKEKFGRTSISIRCKVLLNLM
ncbi:glycosyltransferase [Fusicatenibacter sp.]